MNDIPYHHGNLRNQLIESGILLISEEGVKGFSLRKVAAKCGVSHAAPYSHFKDIEGLNHAMGEYVTEKFTKKLAASMEGQQNNCIAVTLLGNAYIDFFSENPHYFQFLFYNSNLTIDLDSDENDDYPPFALFKKTAYQMFCDMGLAKDTYLNNLLALWSMVHGIASLLTNKGVHYTGDWNAILKESILSGESKCESIT